MEDIRKIEGKESWKPISEGRKGKKNEDRRRSKKIEDEENWKDYGNERKEDVENKRETDVEREKSWNLKQSRKQKGRIDGLIAYHYLIEDKAKGLNDPSKRYESNLEAKK